MNGFVHTVDASNGLPFNVKLLLPTGRLIEVQRPNNSDAMLWVGTSNIVLPGSKSSFPDTFRDKSRLAYYASLFNTVEINSSFYKLPQEKTWLRWSAEVPADFRFSVKLAKSITHVKNLQFNVQDIANFMKTVALPAAQRGCLLVQFPGKISFDYAAKVAELLTEVQQNNTEQSWTVCVEFRHSSWYNKSTIELLNAQHAAMVLHDMPASRNEILFTAAPVVYIRFHGAAGDYRGSYATALLDTWGTRCDAWIKEGKEVYIYFNNTIGDAFNNARYMRRMQPS